MRVAAGILGLAAFGALVTLAVAGVTGATAVLVTAGTVVALIALGNVIGGRKTPDRAPRGGPPDTDEDVAGPGAEGHRGTLER